MVLAPAASCQQIPAPWTPLNRLHCSRMESMFSKMFGAADVPKKDGAVVGPRCHFSVVEAHAANLVFMGHQFHDDRFAQTQVVMPDRTIL